MTGCRASERRLPVLGRVLIVATRRVQVEISDTVDARNQAPSRTGRFFVHVRLYRVFAPELETWRTPVCQSLTTDGVFALKLISNRVRRALVFQIASLPDVGRGRTRPIFQPFTNTVGFYSSPGRSRLPFRSLVR